MLATSARTPAVRCCAPRLPEPELADIDDLEPPEPPPSFSVRLMPGVCDPLGFFDPAGFSNTTEGRLKFCIRAPRPEPTCERAPQWC